MNTEAKTSVIIMLSFIVVMTAALTACSTPKVSDSLYRQSEVGRAKKTTRCRVLAVREVKIRGERAHDMGSAAGAIVGGTLGSGVGKGTGRVLASEIGAIAGAVIGNKAGDKMAERKGLEYSVITSSGEEYTFVQAFLKDDRVVNVGETCRMQVSHDGRNRILPAENLAGEVMVPKETKVVSPEK